MGQNVIGQRDCQILFKYNMSRKKSERQIDFLHEDKYQSFLQVDRITFGRRL